ncbi:unnamed protein product [Protopolystoma xenopodis]|uniref:Cadherin domain-containing protein n=1 Tax=Protopolystoma xenopodis TaxID=117903 RepID=A0A3S5C8B6_9PLAT|nr:unnamed protein product [Protopolystoma xenopodis]
MLLASDAVGPMATATATAAAKSTATARVRVRVLVTDVNDNAPRLSGRRVFRVIENQPGYSEPVGQLTGVDPDAGLNGTFEFRLVEVLAANRLRLPEAEKIFSLAAKTGRLFVQSALDREQQAVYHLLVRIQDLGRPTARNTTEEVRIEVADENDNPPVWQTPRAFGLYVDYTPTSPSPSPSPLTTQARRLLNAALRWAGSDQVELYEYGLVNLSRPVLPGHSIVTLAASDPDAPENANLTFDLIAVQPLRTPTTTPTPTPTATATATAMTMSVVTRGRRLTGRDDVNSLFSLNRLTGDLQTGSGSLAQGLFEVRLRVSDNGQPTLTTDARLFVHTAGPSLGLTATATSCLAPVSSVDVDVGAVDVKRRLPLVEHDRSYSDAAGLLPPAYPPGLDPTAHLCQVPTSPNHATSTPNRHLLIAPPYLRSDDDRCLGYAMATRLFAPGSGSCRLDAWRSRADEPSLASLEANHHQTGLLDLSLGLPGMETDSILTHHMSAEYASLFKSPGSFFSDRGHVKSTDNSPALHSLR